MLRGLLDTQPYISHLKTKIKRPVSRTNRVAKIKYFCVWTIDYCKKKFEKKKF